MWMRRHVAGDTANPFDIITGNDGIEIVSRAFEIQDTTTTDVSMPSTPTTASTGSPRESLRSPQHYLVPNLNALPLNSANRQMLNQLYVNLGLGHLISLPSSPVSLTGFSPPEGFGQHSHVHRNLNLRLGQELDDITLSGDYELWVLNRYTYCIDIDVFLNV